MLDSLYAWIKNIAYYMILITAFLHIVPNETYRKYIKFFTGMTLVLLMLSPLIQLFGMDKKIEFETEYLEEVTAEEYLPELDRQEEEKDIKIEKIEIGD